MEIKKTLLSLCASAALTVSGYSYADWTGDFELGAFSLRGNSESTTVNALMDLNNAKENWHHNIFGQFFYAKSSGTRTAENCYIGYKPRYFLSKNDYLFSFLRYGQDKFASIDHRTTGVAGYGRQLSFNENHSLDAELGLGARQTIYLSSQNTHNLDTNELIYFLGGKYTFSISKSVRFTETARIESGQDNSYVTSVSSLGYFITGNLSAKLNYIARYNTDITGDNGKKSDFLTSITLVYSI